MELMGQSIHSNNGKYNTSKISQQDIQRFTIENTMTFFSGAYYRELCMYVQV